MDENGLIFTASGIRGIVGKGLTPQFVKNLSIAFGTWLNMNEKKVVIGRDTRHSGKTFEKVAIEGLMLAGCEVINFGICPTPVIIFSKNKLNIPAGLIISGSHNPPQWNGIKILYGTTFIGDEDLKQIINILKNIPSGEVENRDLHKEVIQKVNPIPEYLNELFRHVNKEKVKKVNKLKIAIDTGAGAGKYVTPQLLKELGCKTILINNEFNKDSDFPREQEPIAKNLHDLIVTVIKEKCDVGFAHDCDADRLAIIGNDGTYFPEDTGLAIIANYQLQKYQNYSKKIFVTNLASSLMFDLIAEKFNAEIIRTPIGERNLAIAMEKLRKELSQTMECLVFGGEGSCGGVMFPVFNNARDGIFASAKLIEILIETQKSLLELAAELPIFHAYREKVSLRDINISNLITELKRELIAEGEKVSQIGLDLRFGKEKEWFVLVHPSNTEPIIRVIAEAKRESLARIYCQSTAELLKLINSKMK